jgi:hypothetical protein
MTLLAEGQNRIDITTNSALQVLDAVVQLSVIDKDLTSPPVSPTEGDRYIVGPSATDAWSGQDGAVAAYQNGAWLFYTPMDGWTAWVQDELSYVTYFNSTWGYRLGVNGPNGSQVLQYAVEEHLTSLSGASVTSTVSFPNQCIIDGCALRVTEAITGAASFDCGDGTTQDRFGGSLGVALDSTNQGTIGPAGNYSDTTVTLTANGGGFTGGAVRISLLYRVNVPPVS